MITVIKRIVQILSSNPATITVIKRVNQINVTTQNPQQGRHLTRNFYFTAESDGENVFTLPSYFRSGGIVDVYINGTGQAAAKPTPDFTIAENKLTVPGLSEGDNVYGFYEVA